MFQSVFSSAALLAFFWLATLSQQTPTPPADRSEDVVVIGHRPPRCRPWSGDPQNQVKLAEAATGHRQMIALGEASGKYELVSDFYPETGPLVWQRAAQHMDQYVFRTPAGGDTVCIGARKSSVPGEAQLRRAFAAKPYWGQYVVLSAFVAARGAGRVDMWVATGVHNPAPRAEDNVARDIVGGGFRPVPISGDYKWKQVNLLVGPVPCMAAQISYGVQLQGSGDVWLSKVAFVSVPENKLSHSMLLRPHGSAMLRSNPICRHYLEGRPLWERWGGKFRIAEEKDIVPTNLLFDRKDDPFRDDTKDDNLARRGDFSIITKDQFTAPYPVEF